MEGIGHYPPSTPTCFADQTRISVNPHRKENSAYYLIVFSKILTLPGKNDYTWSIVPIVRVLCYNTMQSDLFYREMNHNVPSVIQQVVWSMFTPAKAYVGLHGPSALLTIDNGNFSQHYEKFCNLYHECTFDCRQWELFPSIMKSSAIYITSALLIIGNGNFPQHYEKFTLLNLAK